MQVIRGGCIDEQEVVTHADMTLHYFLEMLLAAMGVRGIFKGISRSNVVGAPDRVWITGTSP